MGFIGWAVILNVPYFLAVDTFAPGWFDSQGYYAGVTTCWVLAFVMAYTTGKRPTLSSFLATTTGAFILCGLVSLAFGIWARFIKEPDDEVSWPFNALMNLTGASVATVSLYCIMLGTLVMIAGVVYAPRYMGKKRH
ncbi:hypothetical protein QU24_19560 [Pantoea rodasii]|uniref:Uncharacterized protein n=1 Tax=Pantoea rodasii TaxID=1076549 RepID=A0A0B1R197_9GAMM|nr:hypothetical protein [Pantoea rodasii]KHJ66404.1 hypothetical protein QU24_19560 [Pantoea rodasii]